MNNIPILHAGHVILAVILNFSWNLLKASFVVVGDDSLEISESSEGWWPFILTVDQFSHVTVVWLRVL